MSMKKINEKKKGRPPSKRGRKKGEQTHFDGMAPTKNSKIHPIAVSYARVRDHRIELGREEDELKKRLKDVMKSEGVEIYEYEDVLVVMTHTDDVKVSNPQKPAKKKKGDE